MTATTTSGRTRSWLSVLIAIALSLTWFGLVAVQALLNKASMLGQTEWWPAASLWRLILGLPLYLVVIPLVWKLLRGRTDPVSWSEGTGWRLPKSRLQWLWLALLLGAPLMGLAYPGAAHRVAASLASPVLVLVALQPPLVEETLMRGLFVHVMDRGGWPRWVTTVVGGVCFALWHVVSFGPSGWLTGVFCIPLMFVPRFLTGGVLASTVIHLLLNSGAGNVFSFGLIFLIDLAALVVWAVHWRRRRTGTPRSSGQRGASPNPS